MSGRHRGTYDQSHGRHHASEGSQGAMRDGGNGTWTGGKGTAGKTQKIPKITAQHLKEKDKNKKRR